MQLKPVTKAEWIAALRSGDYSQTKGNLFKNGSYCCLGVLCHLGGAPDEVMTNTGTILNTDRQSTNGGAAYNLYNSIGLGNNIHTVFEMNDSGRTFPEIADWIEENLPDA